MTVKEELTELLEDIYVVILGIRNPRTGKPIKFNLAHNENKYVYFHAQGSSKQFCYTPHADLDGWFYSWVYQPIGKGARTGKATRWTLKKLQPHRRRKAAKSRALKLLNKGKRNYFFPSSDSNNECLVSQSALIMQNHNTLQ